MNQAHESLREKLGKSGFEGIRGCPAKALAEASMIDTWLGVSTNPLEL